MWKSFDFWLASFLTCYVHGLVFVLVFVLWLIDMPPSSRPLALVALGDSSVEGLPVDAVALDPGAYRYGPDNTPGGDDGYKPADGQATPPPPVDEKPSASEPARLDVPEMPLTREDLPAPEPPPVVKAPERPKPPVAMTTPEQAPKTTPETTGGSQLPGGAWLPLGTPSRGGTVGASNGVRQIGAARPVYPRAALLSRPPLEGRVVLLLRISAEGSVTEAKVHTSSGHAILDAAALDFGQSLRFQPARENYQAVETTARYPVEYRLVDPR